VMESLKILSFFDSITISSETGYAKPHPGIFEAAIRVAGVPANRILFIGDNLTDDVQAGAAAGLHTILVDRHGRYSATDGVPIIQNLRQVLNELLTRCS
jgi:putative hydrolase of the HAD superfamily